MADEKIVEFRCVKEGNRLRVRITSPGYNSLANCQFPRNVREDGGVYTAPASVVRFGKGPNGKFFYRVSAKHVTKLAKEKANLAKDNAKIHIEKVYEEESEDCIVCFDKPHDVVFAPCGHYCLCSECANTIKQSTGKCPMCRCQIEHVVTLDQVQI